VTSGGTYLDDIVAWHRRRAASDDRDLAVLRRDALQSVPRESDRFVDALRRSSHLAVIAEVKRRSPSKGDIAVYVDAGALADEYARGGAACVSVLTDAPHFGGSPADLAAARSCGLPILRKDFTVDERDVLDARLMGADAVLLVVAALSDQELRRFMEVAAGLHLSALVEVHDEAEMGRALAAGATLVGVNQRDLRTFRVDTQRAERLSGLVPAGVVAVAESGITSADDARRCARAGYRAVLVGEHLVRAADRPKALSELQVALPS